MGEREPKGKLNITRKGPVGANIIVCRTLREVFDSIQTLHLNSKKLKKKTENHTQYGAESPQRHTRTGDAFPSAG